MTLRKVLLLFQAQQNNITSVTYSYYELSEAVDLQ